VQGSSFDTFAISAVGSSTPTTIVKASNVPMRALVSNVGPTLVWVGDEVTDLVPTQGGAPTMANYRILPGEQHVFVLTAIQSLYALANAMGGMLSISLSEAIPTDVPRV
jgi:hypothetical protein